MSSRPSWGSLARAIGTATALASCAPRSSVVQAPVEEQRCSRSFRLEGIDAAVERQVSLAAEDWVAFSGGRVRITLDDDGRDDLVGLQEDDPRAVAISFEHDTSTTSVLGLTRRKGDHAVVYVMLGRVSRARLWRVIAHEMGHACGLEDLAEAGEVMSGDEGSRAAPVTGFGARDRDHCAGRGLCDP